MGTKRLILESVFILAIITAIIIALNSFQIHRNAAINYSRLQEQYFDATIQIYKDSIIGNILLDDISVESALLDEILKERGIGVRISYENKIIQSADFKNKKPLKIYILDIGNYKKAVLELYPMNVSKVPEFFNDLITPIFLEALVLFFGFLYLWYQFNKKLLKPLADLAANLKPGQLENYSPKKDTIIELIELSKTLKIMNAEIQQKSYFEAEIKSAKQVVHDIRSPLASLTLLLAQATSLPEKHRTLMRSAIQRISDIANSLYSKAEKMNDQINETVHKIESFMISSLVDSLISEKRMQIREKENIQINLNLEKSYGLFSKVNSVEFKRALSNLIDNSVEAFDIKPHTVLVTVDKIDPWVIIKIQDDGEGIPADILNKIGQYGFSYGKEKNHNSGTGLGLHHAIKTIEAFNGILSIDSVVNHGTTVTIKLPQGEIPNWFIEEIKIEEGQKVVILDDDQSIHNLWRDKFFHLNKEQIELIYFSSGDQFRIYYIENIKGKNKKTLFLVDYELLNQKKTGLDIVEELDISRNAVLVTSYYEEPSVKARASRIGICMIPKGMAAFVPVICDNTHGSYNL